MYLSKLSIKNFRSCYDTVVDLQGSLTLLVGENNSGKSNVIQALQLITAPLSGRPSRYFEQGDISIGNEGQSIEIHAEFGDATRVQQGLYLPALDPDTNTVHYRTTFSVDERGSRFSRPVTHAGKFGGFCPVKLSRRRASRLV
jgi:putative ATP-dependent endonuclease of the OLD family